MIPQEYLRVKISNKGNNIAPVFCTSDNDLLLLANLIREYEEAAHKRLRKRFLADRIRKYEIDNGDARLVRGICTLLERKCIFVNTMEQKQNKLTFALEIPQLDSKELRRNLFEESARREIALNIDKRNEIIRTVSSRLGIDQDLVQDLIWNDLDENFRLQSFLGLEPTALAAWYNLALVQTLLFSCNHLEFSLQGGTRWKGVLREVKRQGLMYSMRSQKSADYSTSGLEKISCSVDGPLSVLKMTEIYGTALAKLIPYIIDSKGWSIQASIVRNSLTSGKKVYDFQLTNDVAPTMSLPFHYSNGYGLASSRSAFDSGLEEKFAVKFEKCETGWTMTREPDPIILGDGRVLIPDFLFERYGYRIYLEIIGFWTVEYLKRKINKLIQMGSGQQNQNSSTCDIFVAINREYLTSSAYQEAQLEFQKLRSLLRFDHLILYEKAEVPLKQILSYLKTFDRDLVFVLADTFSREILIELERIIVTGRNKADSEDYSNGIISLSDLATRFNVPIEAVHAALNKKKADNLSLTDYVEAGYLDYIVVGHYLIRKDLVAEIQTFLLKVNTFSEAILVFDKFKIPQYCHIDLLSRLGYDVVWRGIDTNNATIKQNEHKSPSSK